MYKTNSKLIMTLILLFCASLVANASTTVNPGDKTKIKAKTAMDTFSIEKQKSTLGWKGTKLKGQHVGLVKITKGKLMFKAGDLVDAEFEVDMDSITASDVKDPKWNKKLVTHLKSKDFFDVANFKIAKLKTTSVKIAKGGDFDVMGILTIKGQPKQINFKVKLEKKGSRYVHATGKLVFDRTHYGITYKSGNFFQKLGDKLIHDPVELKFDIMAKSIL